MPGALNHSPADVVRRVLIHLGLGTSPTLAGTTSWPIYASDEPPSPDNVVTVFNTTGIHQGRIMYSGEVEEHHGFQIRVRSVDERTGFAKARNIANTIDLHDNIYRLTIAVEGSTYLVHSLDRSGDVISLGLEKKDKGSKDPPSKRKIFTINGRCHITMS